MSDLSTRTLAPLIANTSKRLGVDLPKPVLEAIESANTIRSARRSIVQDVPNLTAAVATAVLANKDPLASKDVQRALLVGQLDAANIEIRLGNHADDRAASAIIEHSEAIVDTWRPIVERANEALIEFRTIAPGVDMFDDHLATRLPAASLTPWGRARECAAHLEILAKGWQQLAQAAGVHILPNAGRPLIFADVPLDLLSQLDNNAKAGDVVSLDVPLDLANLDTYAERAARITRERQEAQQFLDNAPERAREERRKTFGMVRIPQAS
jgi:hypothetical protein